RPAEARLLEHARGGADLAGRAVTTLKRVVLDERLLQRMDVVVVRKPLDRRDRFAFVRDGEREAALCADAVDQDSAGAALAVIAPLLGAGEAELLAQEVEQRRARVENERVLDPVDAQADPAARHDTWVTRVDPAVTPRLRRNAYRCPHRRRR